MVYWGGLLLLKPLEPLLRPSRHIHIVKAYLGGYAETGPTIKTFCNPTKIKGKVLASCEKAFDEGTDQGNTDRELAASKNATSTCNGKGIKVSKALGTGGCIGGGNQNPIFALVAYGVQFLTGLFGIILVLVLVIAGFEYVISGEDPEISKDAKERVKAVLTGLILFVIMFTLMQIILPSDVRIFTTS